MSSGLTNSPNAPEKAFRGVNGNSISLDETTNSSRYPNNSGVIKFVLRNNRKFSLRINFLLIILVAVVFAATTHPAVLVGVSVLFLALQCKCFISSVNIDTLLVVESVGIQIIGKRVFSSQESSTFLPWNTVQDIFINEVITGQRVLYYLTFLVKESVGGKETTKLVPLFHEIKPERKCLEYINTEGFAYPKELTKVIRRIIKSQPRQGQQFGTRHLLVTYNHSAWMRQDKMFAMLKFRDRTDATAFPHAFVLTVKTLNVSTTEELRPDKSDDRAIASSEVAKNTRLQGTSDENEETLQDSSPDGSSRDLELENDIDVFDQIPASEEQSEPPSTDAAKPETERKKDPGKATKREKPLDDVESAPPVKKHNRRGQPISEKTKHKESAKKGLAADSADLPYQYIIEKEIEDSKSVPEDDCLTAIEAESCPGPSHGHGSLPGKLLPRSPRAAQTDAPRSADITDLVMEGLMFTIRQDQDSVTVVEQKTKLEMDEVLENSEKSETKEGEKCLVNSSLLRLENLITKIEMSEARLKSNEDTPKSPIGSEKSHIEKPFLYSSSTNSTNFDGSSGKHGKTPRSRSLAQSPVPEMPKFPLVKINLSNIGEVLNDKLLCDLEAKGPEAGEVAEDSMEIGRDLRDRRQEDEAIDREMEEEEEEDEVGLELKYDDKDDSETDRADREEDCDEEEEIVPEAMRPKTDPVEANDRPKFDLCTTPIKDCIEIIKSKTPRIVSNEIVTDDQIPPELQRALRFKRTKRSVFGNEIETKSSDASATIDEDSAPDGHLSQTQSPVAPTEERIASETQPDKSVNTKRSIATIDITEEFEQELSSEKRRKQPSRRKSLRHAEETPGNASQSAEEPEIRIEMWKFMEDITRGAKVVVRRLDLTNIQNGVVTESSLAKYNTNQRYATES